jgi:predicted DNA-binding transcriptional regulator AlpA
MSERTLVTITDAAKIICVSRATIHRMIQACDYDRLIAQGTKSEEDVPRAIRGYEVPIPRVIRLGPRCVRLNRAELEAWVASKAF